MPKKRVIPSEVWVVGHRYSIEQMDDRLFKEREAYGDCCNEKKIIRVYCGVAESIIRDTLLHEMLHAAWDLGYIDQSDDEEKIVSRISTILIGLFDDPRNAEVKKFLFWK